MIENLRYLSTSILEVPNIKSNRGTTGFASQEGKGRLYTGYGFSLLRQNEKTRAIYPVL